LRPEAEQGVLIRDRIAGESRDLSVAVNHARPALISAEGSKVCDLAVLPEDSILLRPPRYRIERTIDRLPGDQPVFADPAWIRAVATRKRFQINKLSILPFKRMENEGIRTPRQD
jgi:hypothetical protein